MNVNSRIARANFTGNDAGPIASFTAYRSSNASILIDDHYFTPADNKAKVCNTPMPVSQLWTIDSSFNGMVNFNELFNINGTIGKNNGNVEITDNILTFTSTYKSTYQYINQTIAFPQNHKFLLSVDVTLSQNENIALGDGTTIFGVTAVSANTKTRINRVYNYSNARNSFYLYPARNAGLDIGETMVAENFLVIDLTQMFGSTIADYIYTLEQNVAGAGVAYFRSIYPNDYYAYDAGTDEMVGSREGSIITLPIDVKTSITPNIGSNNIFADCGYVDAYYVTI